MVAENAQNSNLTFQINEVSSKKKERETKVRNTFTSRLKHKQTTKIVPTHSEGSRNSRSFKKVIFMKCFLALEVKHFCTSHFLELGQLTICFCLENSKYKK